MDSYQKLRSQARLKRDAAIAAAHEQYGQTLRTISGLRKTLGGEGSVKPVRKDGTNFAKGQRALALIRQVLPRDREFTTGELVSLLKIVAPEQGIPDSSLRAHLRRLEDQRALERVRRDGDGQVIWRAVGAAAEPQTPLASMNLPDAASLILAEAGPMGVKELAIAIQARGCREGASRKVITESLAAALRDNPKRFICDADGLWASEYEV